uniref:Solute carrier family 15 member 2-like n=1 Tax=Saccoglossus kowalevskii TaxID=10224 RepID=A0ABM0MGV0_SACKO|nr:PREDICTED: solute carrier family 15 member 2-like [Saccoglossus kowalevskii]
MGRKGKADFSAQADIAGDPPPKYISEDEYKDKDSVSDLSSVAEVIEDMEGEKASCSERYPKQIYFILGMEFCERYCYYGMKAILILYFTEVLLMSDNDATTLYHTFAMLCYLTPIGGAMLSDGFWGKYKTIFRLAWVYLLGCVLLSLSSIQQVQAEEPTLGGCVFSLLLIAIGTGGIKPCVAAFGGDQFRPDQVLEIQTFFLIYYFAINCGSLLSTFLTPILREDVQCFGGDCYPLAFGVPAALLLVAIIIFVCGRYTVGYIIHPGTGNVVWEFCKAIGHAGVNKVKYRKEWKGKYSHWIEWASDTYPRQLILDTKCVLHILIMYIPLPMFWALFDQQGSRWTLQATQMNGNFGNISMKPDQMQIMNPLFILLLIPIFDNCIYPLLRKCGIRCTYLQRMCWGMFFAGFAFYCAGLLQIKVNETNVVTPCIIEESGQTGMIVFNAASSNISVKQGDNEVFEVPTRMNSDHIETTPGIFQISVSSDTSDQIDFSIDLVDCSSNRLIVADFEDADGALILDAILVPDKYEKPDNGMVFASYVFTLVLGDGDLLVDLDSEDYDYHDINATLTPTLMNYPESEFRVTTWLEIEPGSYTACVHEVDSEECKSAEGLDIYNGGAYTTIWHPITPGTEENGVIMDEHETVPANAVPMLWQIPQYLLITTGEVMFSITGLEFSYAQAPASMKSTLQAFWLLTVAGGNLLVIIQTSVVSPRSMHVDFFIFATLMMIVAVIYVGMSYWYTYIEPSDYILEDEEEDDEKKEPIDGDDRSSNSSLPEKENSLGMTNMAMDKSDSDSD